MEVISHTNRTSGLKLDLRKPTLVEFLLNGDLVKGIKDHGDSFESETYVLQKSSLTNIIVKNIIKK